jgi:hypothetical protein
LIQLPSSFAGYPAISGGNRNQPSFPLMASGSGQ